MRPVIGRIGHRKNRPRRWCPTGDGDARNANRGILRLLAIPLVISLFGCGLLERDQPAPLITSAVSGPRIVVLPFQNAGPADDDFFAAGMTDEIAERWPP